MLLLAVRAMHSDDDDDEEEEPSSSIPAPILAQHLTSLLGTESESDDEEDPPPTAADDATNAGNAASSSNVENGGESSSSSRQGVQATTADMALASADAPSVRAALPSADLALATSAGSKESFLHIDQPDFDASKVFKPPVLTAADMMPAGHAPAKQRAKRSISEEAPEQQYHRDYHFGVPEGATRLRGSVCLESDDERGRRVRYGAHQALKADPWSDCNPNFSMKRNKR